MIEDYWDYEIDDTPWWLRIILLTLIISAIFILAIYCNTARADSTDVSFTLMASDAGDTLLGYVDSVVFTNIYCRGDSVGSGAYTTPDTGRIICTVRVAGLYNGDFTADAYLYYDNAFDDVEWDYTPGYWAGYAVSTASSSDTVTVILPTAIITGSPVIGAIMTVTLRGSNTKDTCNNVAIGNRTWTATTNASGIASILLIKNGCFDKTLKYNAELVYNGATTYREQFSIDDTTTSIWYLGR